MKKILITILILGLIGLMGLILINNCVQNKTTVKIITNPSDGEIYIKELDKNNDWIFYGKTPLSLELNMGEYEIKIIKDNYLIKKEKYK